MAFDRIDIRILEVIQENGDFNDAEVARFLDLPQTSVWRRIAALPAVSPVSAAARRCAMVAAASVGVSTAAIATALDIQRMMEPSGWREPLLDDGPTRCDVVERHTKAGYLGTDRVVNAPDAGARPNGGRPMCL